MYSDLSLRITILNEQSGNRVNYLGVLPGCFLHGAIPHISLMSDSQHAAAPPDPLPHVELPHSSPHDFAQQTLFHGDAIPS